MSRVAHRGALLACLVVLPVATGALVAPASAVPGPVAAASSPNPDTGSLAGTVTDELGRPLQGVQVSVTFTITTSPNSSESRQVQDSILTDAGGRWRFDGLPPGTTYSNWFSKDGYDATATWEGIPQTVVEAGRTTTKDVFLVETSATVVGRVVDRQGVPIQGASVSGYGASGGTTGADGTFRGKVTPGDHTMGVYADGYRPIWDLGWSDPRTIHVSADRGRTTDLGTLVLRRWGAEPCWTEDGEWWDRDPKESFPRFPATPPLWPKSEHLCPDVDASELPVEQFSTGVRVGVPAPPTPAVTTAAKPTSAGRPQATPATAVVAATLRAARSTTVTGSVFTVRSACATACGGRIVATSGRTVVATSTVRTGGGTRTHRLRLTAAGRRLLARAHGSLAIRLRWEAPGSARDAAGPRTRIVRSR